MEKNNCCNAMHMKEPAQSKQTLVLVSPQMQAALDPATRERIRLMQESLAEAKQKRELLKHVPIAMYGF
jgi:hypothetical protein